MSYSFVFCVFSLPHLPLLCSLLPTLHLISSGWRCLGWGVIQLLSGERVPSLQTPPRGWLYPLYWYPTRQGLQFLSPIGQPVLVVLPHLWSWVFCTGVRYRVSYCSVLMNFPWTASGIKIPSLEQCFPQPSPTPLSGLDQTPGNDALFSTHFVLLSQRHQADD